MILYASATNGRENLHAMQRHGYRLLFAPGAAASNWRDGWRCALDNGAWSAHTSGESVDLDAFGSAVSRWGAHADWVVAPDIVAGGQESWALTLAWLPRLLPRCRRVLLAVQDGMEPHQVAPYLSDRVGVAIGGSDGWKERELASRRWGRLCRSRGAWLHGLRVNTMRRIRLAADSGADSIDGKSATIYSVNAPKVRRWASQPSLLGVSCL